MRYATFLAALFAVVGLTLVGSRPVWGLSHANPRLAVQDSNEIVRIMALEDARPTSPDSIAPILAALRATDPSVRRVAVRALGRFERPSLAESIASMLSDDAPDVRAEAANALAQAVLNGNPAEAARWILARLETERDARVLGVMAASLGRMRYESPEAAFEVAAALVGIDDRPEASGVASLGVARGLDWIVRLQQGEPLPDPIVARLRVLSHKRDGASLVFIGTRRFAMSALVASGAAGAVEIEGAMADVDAEVRRLGALGLARLANPELERNLFRQALSDEAAQVRYEGLRSYARMLRTTDGCGPLVDALSDSAHIRLLAIDLLGEGCQRTSGVDSILTSIVRSLPAEPANPPRWHAPAHALVSLAKLAPLRASTSLQDLSTFGVWQVRAYAARAAAIVRDTRVLQDLAADPEPNVREAALRGLVSTVGHDGEELYIAALESDDYQLLITASQALGGSDAGGSAVPALVAALQRTTRQERETSRDARRALLQRIGELGTPSLATDMSVYLKDFDPLVARDAAAIVARWTGNPQTAEPRPLERTPFPSLEELRRIARLTATVEMRNGGSFVLRLYPFEAPANAARFVRLAESGHFDGLTFHRVVPNFVIQGGSPGANEFWGDGPFSRDELTMRPHVRGTVGLSTRGRDTGDSQIFVNLVDNVRLDFNYTIYAEVTDGMDTVDAVLEGAVIQRITFTERH